MGSAISKPAVFNELRELKASLDEMTLSDVAAEIQRELDLLENTVLDIAITGESGVGKSSLVNALRGVEDGGKGAAETGVTQKTMDPERYSHPSFSKITIWDLPGIATTDFHPEDYLEKVNFSRYDFFIVVIAECFTLSYNKLIHEILKMKKKCYYIRSKVDCSLLAEQRKPNFNEEKTLQEIRNYCCSQLQAAGLPLRRVFLISSWHRDQYDFPSLMETLENELSHLKRHAFQIGFPLLLLNWSDYSFASSFHRSSPQPPQKHADARARLCTLLHSSSSPVLDYQMFFNYKGEERRDVEKMGGEPHTKQDAYVAHPNLETYLEILKLIWKSSF